MNGQARSIDHDPLCLYYGERNEGDCTMCGVIATVRVHERDRIARAIEARALTHENGRAYRHAARIARDGGRDE